jgi:hypothetical protein
VKATQFHEFATNPSAVTVADGEVAVQDWLVQPIAAATVADVLIDIAPGPARTQSTLIAGPEAVRLPDLTGRLLRHFGDDRPVRAVAPDLQGLAEGLLLAPEDAVLLGPGVEEWLNSQDARTAWQQV